MINSKDIVPGQFFKSSDCYYIGKIVLFGLGFSGPDTKWGNKETMWSGGWTVVDGKILGYHYHEGTTGYSCNRNGPDDRHVMQLWIVEPEPHMLAGATGQTELSL